MDIYAAPFDIEGKFPPAGRFANFGVLASDILWILTGLAGSLSIIFIILAGIKFVTAAGDEKKMASAASSLTYAIIGLAVTTLAFVILKLIQWFFRAEVI